MYAVIYWLGEDKAYPLLAHDNEQIKLFDTLKKADETANAFEAYTYNASCRVISIEGIKP